MTTPFKTYYVYSHYDPWTNECLYVGMGKGSRAYQTGATKSRPTQRSYVHNTYLEELLNKGVLPHEWIRFEGRGLEKQQALTLEKDLIKLLNPKFNNKVGPKASISREDSRKILEIYSKKELTYEQIGSLFGVSRSTIYRVIRNKRVY